MAGLNNKKLDNRQWTRYTLSLCITSLSCNPNQVFPENSHALYYSVSFCHCYVSKYCLLRHKYHRVTHYFWKDEHGGVVKKQCKRLPHFPVWENSKLALCLFLPQKGSSVLRLSSSSRWYVIILHHQKPKWFPWQLPPQTHQFFLVISFHSVPQTILQIFLK